MKEHRKHTRLPIILNAEVLLPNGVKCVGKTKNISFGGLFVDLDDPQKLDAGDECDIILLLDGTQGRMEIIIHSIIIHKANTGIGLNFLGIEIDYYEHFKKLLIHNSPEPNTLFEELQKNPGLKIK